MHPTCYVARHLGAPDTAWKTQVRERVAERLSISPTRGTLTPRGLHAAYKRYQPLPVDVRDTVDRPDPAEFDEPIPYVLTGKDAA